MPEATDRPQDVGRPHSRRPAPAPESAAVLEAYRAAMRVELGELLEEIRPSSGQLTIDGSGPARPLLEVRRALWDLAIKLGRELGQGIDQDPPPAAANPSTDPKAARAPRLSARARRSLES